MIAKNTYAYKVKRWLESGKSITSRQAILMFGCTRLSAVIFVLKHEHNMPIETDKVTVKNRNGRWVEVAKYHLPQAA
jgi:hypothetical protein